MSPFSIAEIVDRLARRFRLLKTTALFAACLGASLQINADTGAICGDCTATLVARCGGFLESPALDNQGRLWVVDMKTSAVFRVDGGQCITEYNTGGFPNSAELAPDGRLIIADAKKGLLAFNPQTKAVKVLATGYQGKPFINLNDLSFDDKGGFYFTDPGSSDLLKPDGRVYYFPPGGTESDIVLISDKLSFPNGIAVGPNPDMVYVAEFAAKRITAIPAIGRSGPRFAAHVVAYLEGGLGPDGMMFDTDNRLYAAQFMAGYIAVIDPASTTVEKIPLPPEAGSMVTNLILADDRMIVTDMTRGTIWSLPFNNKPYTPHNVSSKE